MHVNTSSPSSERSNASTESDPYNPADKVGEIIGETLLLKSVLGTGTYGAVYLAINIDTHAESAVKVLWKGGLDDEQLALQKLEIDINTKLSDSNGKTHPNIIAMRNWYEDEECLYLELELHRGGDLYDAIQRLGGLDDSLAKYVFAQIVSALQYCHSRGVYHRDLKPENILVTDDWQCKLCDFGLASMDIYTTELGCGSAPYMSPEARGGYDSPVDSYNCLQSDVWSLGVVLLNVLFGCNPWKVADDSDDAFKSYVQDPNLLRTQFALSNECFDLLESCFDLEPNRRPSVSQVRLAVARMGMFVDPALLDQDVILSSSPTDYPKRENVVKHVDHFTSPLANKGKKQAQALYMTNADSCSASMLPFLQRLKINDSSTSEIHKTLSGRMITAF